MIIQLLVMDVLLQPSKITTEDRHIQVATNSSTGQKNNQSAWITIISGFPHLS
jgi:hypothetical protein